MKDVTFNLKLPRKGLGRVKPYIMKENQKKNEFFGFQVVENNNTINLPLKHHLGFEGIFQGYQRGVMSDL